MIKIQSASKATSKNTGKTYWVLEVEGGEGKHLCFDDHYNGELGDVDATIMPGKDGAKMVRFPSKSGGGWKPKPVEDKSRSFAAAYAKDVTVAMISSGLIKETKSISPSVRHYFDLFIELLDKEKKSDVPDF